MPGGGRHRMVPLLEGDLSPEQSQLLVSMQKDAYADWFTAGHKNWQAMPKSAKHSLDVMGAFNSEGGGKREVTEAAAQSALLAQRTSTMDAGAAAAAVAAGKTTKKQNKEM